MKSNNKALKFMQTPSNESYDDYASLTQCTGSSSNVGGGAII